MRSWLKCATALVLALGCVMAAQAAGPHARGRGHAVGHRGGFRGANRAGHNRRVVHNRGHYRARGHRARGGNHARPTLRAVRNLGRFGPHHFRYFGRFSHRHWSGRFGRWQYWSPYYQRWYFYSDADDAWVAVSPADVDGPDVIDEDEDPDYDAAP
jgi:hypothetical protein